MNLINDSNPAIAPLFWKSSFRTEKQRTLEQAANTLGQMFSYLPQLQQRDLENALVTSPMAKSSILGPLWVRTFYLMGGPNALANLQRYARNPDVSQDNRAIAHTYVQELVQEQVLAENALSSQTPHSKPIRQTNEQTATLSALIPPLSHSTKDRITADTLARHWHNEKLSQHHETLIQIGFAPIIATDCDGTTWTGDIGEELFERAIERRLLRQEANASFIALLKQYRQPVSGDVHRNAHQLTEAFQEKRMYDEGVNQGKTNAEVLRDYYLAATWGFAGHHVWDLKNMARELFEEANGFKHHIIPSVSRVLQSAKDANILPFAVSASNQYIVEVGAEYLCIPPRRVRGICLKRQENILSNRVIDPITFGAGKIESIISTVGAPPIIALGDSLAGTDKELLTQAGLGLVIDHHHNHKALKEHLTPQMRVLHI